MKQQKAKATKKRQRHPVLRRFKWKAKNLWRRFKELKWWQKALLVGAPLIIFALIIPLILFIYFALTMGDMEHLMNRNNTGVVLKDINNQVFYSTGTAEHRALISLDEMSPYITKALVASEDKNFYEHGGISILSTLRAIYGYAFSGGGSFGGSTLTQQLAKMTMLSSERSFLRQYQTLSVAMAIEQRYSKDQILAMYLNSAYFGNNSFGIEQAAKNYFDTEPKDLSLAQSAMLIGLLPAPSYYSPIGGDEDLAKKRQAEVLSRMQKEGYITSEQQQAASAQDLTYQPPAIIKNDAPHFTEMVLNELYQKYGEETVERSGYQVTTTLNLDLQRQANSNIQKQLAYIESRGGSNAGLIAIDAKNGEIRALVGSVDYQNQNWGNVNMVTALRQPGSSFKPIYYAAALADGAINPATIIRDEPININGYSPQNATRRYYGDVTVRQALARSLNIPAVKVMQKFGIANSIAAAKKLGITSLDKDPADYGLALAVGAAEVPLQQITNAYAAFADSGKLHKNTTIHQISNKYDKIIYTNKPETSQAISPEAAYLVSDILADDSARSFMFGSSLTINGKSVAVKTGTTDDNRDAWAVGYSSDLALGVWVGNNDNSPMLSGGADMAGPIWRNTMISALGDSNPQFARPDGVVQRAVCYGNGGLASSAGSNTYNEYFWLSALPTESCSSSNQKPSEEKTPEPEPETDLPEDNSEQSGDGGDGSSGGESSGGSSSGESGGDQNGSEPSVPAH